MRFSSSALFPVLMLFSFAFSAGCGSSKQEEPTPQATAAEVRPGEATTPAYVVQDVVGSTVEGRVLVQGKVPPPRLVQVTQDSGICGKQHEVYSVRAQNGGVNGAVVWIEDITRGKPFAFPPPAITQKDCTFLPHVSIMTPGEIEIESKTRFPTMSIPTHKTTGNITSP